MKEKFYKKDGIMTLLFVFILAYLIGSIPTALMVGKVFFGIDIREHGSNNPGATNTLRVLGKKAAVIVLLIDVGKGAIAALLPLFFDVDISPFYPGLIAVIGHCFPIFAGFRGGKAIATTAGMLLVADIQLFFITYICFYSCYLDFEICFLWLSFCWNRPPSIRSHGCRSTKRSYLSLFFTITNLSASDKHYQLFQPQRT